MARARAGLEADEGLRCGDEFSAPRVEVVNHHLVRAEVTRVRVAVRGIEHDAVRVRPRLTFAVGAGARILPNVHGLSQTAALEYGQHRDVPARVVCDEHEAARVVHGDVAGRTARRRLTVDEA